MNRWLLLSLVACVALAGCSPKADAPSSSTTPPTNTASTEAPKPEPATPETVSQPEPPKPNASASTTQLKIEDTKPGVGKQSLADGDLAYVIYTGRLTSGTVFDSNDKEGAPPFTVRIGAGQVIEGWEKGLVGMKKGGTRKLTIPPELGYGDKGTTGIPPGSTLVFEIKLLDLVKKGEENVWEKTIVKPGKGEGAKTGDKVAVHYTGWLVNGRKFDSSKDRGKPFEFTLGQGQVIAGWDAGVVGTKRGETRKLWIAPGIAYGAQDRGEIPANSILLFEIEMVQINGK
ncbi:MAG TPA: FKBP-type peptidyl-prolyl cis-trans isomerase [Fimbriimonadaceae bacterium]|nr:FKBP-type peptidyl-prolyl cis-trans isomerase [Fimbriimonadaceae bacterium]HRJ32898.1 FKBP-type peptidyl-prolyl cis-trans isomerase [Fimbriimonadaceae bacterium]